MKVTFTSEAEIKALLDALPLYFITNDEGYPRICTTEIIPQKTTQGTCEATVCVCPLSATDRRYKEFAQNNRELFIILQMQRLLKENPKLTGEKAREKAKEILKRVTS